MAPRRKRKRFETPSLHDDHSGHCAKSEDFVDNVIQVGPLLKKALKPPKVLQCQAPQCDENLSVFIKHDGKGEQRWSHRSTHNVSRRQRLVVSHVASGGRELCKPLDHLVYGVQKVLLGRYLPAGPNCVHPCLSAHTLDVGPGRVGTEPCEELEPNVPLGRHRPSVDLEDVRPALQIWWAKLNLAVETSRSEQRGIKRVWAVRCHQHLQSRAVPVA